MKNKVYLLMLITISVMVSSCEKIKSIFDVEVITTLSGTLLIDVDEPVKKSTESYSFYHSVPVSPLDDEDIAEYQDNIKKINTTKIIATIEDVNKTDVVFEKGTMITVKGSSEVTWTLQEPWPITEGQEIILDDDVNIEIYKTVTNMLTDLETLTIIAQGTCNQTEVYVTLVVGIDVKVTANPL
ncbi:MAG: hypothetical protein ACK2TU_02900 [Anaerolineales bacterium]|jgi:hypothetical protein